jgi:hypothetical protein
MFSSVGEVTGYEKRYKKGATGKNDLMTTGHKETWSMPGKVK